MAVRLLGPGDQDLVRGVLRRFKGYETSEPEEFMRDPRALLLIAEDNDDVVGWLYAYELIRPEGDRAMLLYEIEVDVEARRQGHGQELVEALLAEARARRHSEVWVLTDSDNAAAGALYSVTGADETRQVMYTWDVS